MAAFASKSLVRCENACVASSQEQATDIGVEILRKGGNAADSAVAVAAALNVLEPCSTGLGGDAFCLFYDAKTKTVKGINASGCAPQGLTLAALQEMGYSENKKPHHESPLFVTVPGTCAGWVDCVQSFGSGKLSMKEILQPSINLAREGFKMTSPITAHHWNQSTETLCKSSNLYGKEMLIEDDNGESFHTPSLGETFKNPGLANVMEAIAEHGKDGFYKGWVAESIVDTLKPMGGLLTLQDLENFSAQMVEPISIDYKGYRLWEIPPNSQGIVALEALNILKNIDFSTLQHNSTSYLHTLTEAFRLSFADAMKFCGDPQFSSPPLETLLDPKYGKLLAGKINPEKALDEIELDNSVCSLGDTVYFTTADSDGNFCSFINSNYMGFGTGIVPKGCGFTLQNRGFNFSLKPGHPNSCEPGKRPFHTIIPAMLTDCNSGELVMSYGVMGGFMQPQGHVQVLLNMLEYGMDPQQALEAPRLLTGAGHAGCTGEVNLELGVSSDVVGALRGLGHNAKGPIGGFERSLFGRGQIIARKSFWKKGESDDSGADDGGLWAGSDCRADGKAAGF